MVWKPKPRLPPGGTRALDGRVQPGSMFQELRIWKPVHRRETEEAGESPAFWRVHVYW